MATLTHAESRRLYSWWWDSHISPKNSKWLNENLTDMDVKVKTMIKVIEEDADSFARKAEMYYKKRPELMKLVEEFYRAYRALAERYDHATGELRQAQRTMAEAFPNQIPFTFSDDTPPGSSDAEPRTPEMPRPIRTLFEPDDLQMEDVRLSSDFHTSKKNGALFEENNSMTNKKGLKQLNEMFGSNEKKLPECGERRVRKGLNFPVTEGKGSEFKVCTGTSKAKKHELEFQEKGIQYEALNLEERENIHDDSNLREDEASQLSIENQNLKMQILSESIRFEKVEKEASSLREVVSKLKEEKEAAVLQSQQCSDRYHGALGRISDLETEISLAQDEIKRRNDEILKGVAKSRSFEERSLLLERENQNLSLEIDNLVHKLMVQQEEIKEKNQELEKLGIYVQEEHLNSMRIEAGLQNLQQLHFKSQEEQRVLALELQNGVRILKDTESRNQDLENEILRINEENNSLNEQNMSCAISISNLQDELHNLVEKNGKLKEEVGLRVDQRNALQQELHCLKEEIHDLERRYGGITEHIESVGLDPESFQLSVKELQDENLNLKVTCRKNDEEKMVFLEKLGNMDKLLERNKFLENSLSGMSVEIGDLRSKLKTFEESCQSLHEDKITLLTEKGLLVSQVDSITQSLQNLEKTHLELEVQHSGLKMEKQSTVDKVEELSILLELQRQVHENLTQSYNTQLTTLRNQIDLLQEEGRLRKRKLEEEEDKFMNVQLESYMLQLSVRDMKEMYDLLFIECQKHIKKSAIADELSLELKQKNLRQEIEYKLLLDSQSLTVHINQKLLTGIHELLKLLVMIDDGCPDVEDSKIFGKILDMQNYISNDQDEKQKLIFENLINATLLEQMRLGVLDLIEEKESIEMESARRKGKLLILKSEKQKLAEANKQLIQECQEGENREQVLKTEMMFMRRQSLDHQESNLILKNENCKLLEENEFLKKDLCNLKEEKCKLEEENNAILIEASKMENLSLIFEISNTEKTIELKRANGDLDHFRAIKIELENEKKEMMEELGILEMEYVDLTESIEKLEEYRNHTTVLLEELNTLRDLCENLDNQISIGKKLLSQKEMELQQADKNLEAKHIESTKLINGLESIKQELDEVQKMRELLVKQNLMLSEEKINQEQEIAFVHEEKAKLEIELDKLSREIDGFILREESFNSALRNWEVEAATLFDDVQTSSIREALFEVKIRELIETCENLEENTQMEREKFYYEIASKNKEIDELKTKIVLLKGENEASRAGSAAYFPIILSLRESLTLLEDRFLSLANIYGNSNPEQQDVALISHQNNMSRAHEPCEEQNTEIPDGILELQKLQTKVRAVLNAMMESGRLNQSFKDEYKVTEQENSKQDTAEKEVGELKLKNSSVQEEGQTSEDIIIEPEIEHGKLGNDPKVEKTKDEISKGKYGLLTKDIELDHVLDISCYEKSSGNDLEAEDQMLELWETAEQDCGRESIAERNIEYHQPEVVEEEKCKNPSLELQVEKELGLNNVAGDTKARRLQQQKLTDRLSSNARKLQNLQITMQDLESKCEKSKNTNQAMGYESYNLRGQLKQVEETILKYVGINSKLMKNAEAGSFKMGEDAKLEESENMRKEPYELARKASSNIRKLELEVQRIQLVFHRLDQEHEIEESGGVERRSKVLLRDYLYGGRENARKKATRCACMRPSTMND